MKKTTKLQRRETCSTSCTVCRSCCCWCAAPCPWPTAGTAAAAKTRYSVWKDRKHRKEPGYISVVSSNQFVPVHVLPKLEFQLCHGVECLTSSEACQLWTESLLHSNTVSYIGKPLIEGVLSCLFQHQTKPFSFIFSRNVMKHPHKPYEYFTDWRPQDQSSHRPAT